MKPYLKSGVLCFMLLFLCSVSACLRAASEVTPRVFGKTPEGQAITLYTLTNEKGMSVSIMDYGATVVNLVVPDRNGRLDDIFPRLCSSPAKFIPAPRRIPSEPNSSTSVNFHYSNSSCGLIL